MSDFSFFINSTSLYASLVLLCIHRSFFAQAMIDDPIDPLRSPFAPSFLAAYRCASHILLSIKEQFELLPELCSRFWATWTYAFSAAVRFSYLFVFLISDFLLFKSNYVI